MRLLAKERIRDRKVNSERQALFTKRLAFLRGRGCVILTRTLALR
jgi:hypothetical protein